MEIPKKDGKTRELGSPALLDRIAQQVVKAYMEQRVDGIFHENSYGYRSLKSAKQAIEHVRQICFTYASAIYYAVITAGNFRKSIAMVKVK